MLAGVVLGAIVAPAFAIQGSGKPAKPAAPKPSAGPKGKTSVTGPFNKLSDFETYVLVQKGTERAYTGEYTDLKDAGTYVCRRCNAPLYASDSKFESHCGWPSFDDEIKGAVQRKADADGFRTEILCANCGGHLGHVFVGEGFTRKNVRHCVNSVSMRFFKKGAELPAVLKGPKLGH